MNRQKALCAIAGLALMSGGQVAAAATLVVDADGLATATDCGDPVTAAQTTIQDAIDAAAIGDTIVVCPGIYEQDLTIYTDGLTLTALYPNPARTVIQGVATSTGPFPLAVPNIDLQANGVTLQGFRIQSPAVTGSGEYTSGLVIDGTGNLIAGNHFRVSRGDPGSQAIQTWVAGSEGLGDISGLTITGNSFSHSSLDTDAQFGYEAIFINPQSGDIAGNPVLIQGNFFSGRMYRGIGVARANTIVADNTLTTTMAVSNVPEFGGDVPLGIKVFDGDNIWVQRNVLRKGVRNNVFKGPRPLTRFAAGITMLSGGNYVIGNEVKHSRHFDCLDDTSGSGTSGTANLWKGNRGNKVDPAKICTKHKQFGKKNADK